MAIMKPAAVLLIAGALIVAAFVLFAARYGHAAAWRLPAEEQPWVERTLAAAAAGSKRSREDFRRTTRPRLWHRPGQICVILATHRTGGGGSYRACFDRSSGHLLEEREAGPCLCAEPLADRLWQWVW